MKFFKKLVFILFLCLIIGACKTTTRAKVQVQDFKVNMKSPNSSVGSVELQFGTMFGIGNISKRNIDVLYFPKEDAVCLKFNYEFYNYYQFWDKKGRLAFLEALQRYNEDYETRKLDRKEKAQKKYGTVRGYLVWQQLSFTIQARSNNYIDLGYSFQSNSPYFTLYQRATEYVDPTTKDNVKVSANIPMYFTRAQAASLAEIFEQYKATPEANYSDDSDWYEYDDYSEINTPPAKKEVPKDAY
jgi:hypothetical protein